MSITSQKSSLDKANIIDTLIDSAHKQLEDDKVVDLSDLNIRVKEFCDAILLTPPENPRNATERLNSIICSIEDLEDKLNALINKQDDDSGS